MTAAPARDFGRGFAPAVAVTREELSELRSLAVRFHTISPPARWEVEENAETRRALVARIDAIADRQS